MRGKGWSAALLIAAGLPALAAGELATRLGDSVPAVGSGRFEGLVLPGIGPVDLRLSSFSVVSPGARRVVVGDEGTREQPLTGHRAYRGTVVGDPGSRVVLSVVDGAVVGTVETAEGKFTLARTASGTEVVRKFADDPDEIAAPLCAGTPAAVPDPSPGSHPHLDRGAEPRGGVSGSTPLVARIAVEAPYEWYVRLGSELAAGEYILNLMSQVSAIYESEVGVRIEVSYLRLFTTPADPYSDTQDTEVLIRELREEWNANQTDVQRTAVHLFGPRNSGGSGIAYLDVLCHGERFPGNSYDYGVSTLSAFGSSWERKLVAHELGHNFSSPHTHCYEPEIDQCATASGCYAGPVVQSLGTIMSYCGTTFSWFHPRVKEERIRPAAEEALQWCMEVEGQPVPAAPTGVVVR